MAAQLNLLTSQKTTHTAKLNPAQKKAVESISGPVMVIAGPGTGKTEIIANRIANILEVEQLGPENILCLTFTESGVRAMQERLVELIGNSGYGVDIHTFHSFCNSVIMANPESFPQLGFDAEQITEVEKVGLVRKLVDDLGKSLLRPFKRPYSYVDKLLKFIEGLKREGISPAEYAAYLKEFAKFIDATKTDFDELFAKHASKVSEADIKNLLEACEKKGFAGFNFLVTLKLMFADYEHDKSGDAKQSKNSLTKLRAEIRSQFRKITRDGYLEKQTDSVKIYQNYQDYLLENNLYDFDDMIIFVKERFKEDKELLQDYQERYQYILLDEYQDTNSAQNDVVTLLGSYFPNPNIFAVGDDDQSIFRFQGASLENFLYFRSLYRKHLQVITLTDNYRSQQTVLDAAGQLISGNDYRISEIIEEVDKTLVSRIGVKSAKLLLDVYKTEEEEVFAVADKISSLLKKGVKAEEIAVIYRANRDAELIEQVLSRKQIPYRLDKGEDILKEKFVQQLIDLISYLLDINNDELLFKILNFDFLGISPLDLAKISRYSYENNVRFSEPISSNDLLLDTNAVGVKKISAVYETLAKFAKESVNEHASVMVQKLIYDPSLNFMAHLLAGNDAYRKVRKLNKFFRELKKAEARAATFDLKDFVAELKLYAEYKLRLEDKINIDKAGTVLLTTAHSAKGLQFEHVFIIKLTRGNWEKRRSQSGISYLPGLLKTALLYNKEDEERRLLYVALTRAKVMAYLSYAQLSADEKAGQPSGLLDAIAETNLLTTKHEDDPGQESARLLDLMKPESLAQFSTKGQEFLQQLLARYKMSPTHLNSYLDCPRCFFFKTILKIPMLRSPAEDYGSAVHEALKDFIISYRNSKKLPGLNYLLERFAVNLHDSKMPGQDLAHYLSAGKESLQLFYAKNKTEFSRDSKVEYGFGSKNVHLGKIPLTGKIDRIDFVDAKPGIVDVIDYKTGNPESSYSKAKVKPEGGYYNQLGFYKLLIDNCEGINWQVDKLKLQFVEPGNKSGELVSVNFNAADIDLKTLTAKIEDVYAKIMTLEFSTCGTKCETKWMHDLPAVI